MTSWGFEIKGQIISKLFLSNEINIFLIFVKKYVTGNKHFSLKTYEKYFYNSTFLLKEIQACNYV